ncbi:MAG: diguanylate cyclase [Pirellula sp.]|jgi:diguanylate cyclase (GGDEF)-like protein|nr:diguanylate cyclase [Pirellula sp.]
MSSGLNSSTNPSNLSLEEKVFPSVVCNPALEVRRLEDSCSGAHEIDQLLSDLDAPFPASANELTSKKVRNASEETIRKELDYFKRKAIEQDIEIFEMRALLQSGKGLSNILNLKQLLDTFMAVVREKYSAVNTAVLLKDDLENAEHCFRVKAHFGLDEKFRHPSGMEESIYMYKFPKNNGLLWQLIQQGNVFSVRDMQRGPRFKHAWKQWNMNVLKSDVWCPLIKSGEVLGILTIGEREDGSQIPESDYAFIQELASIAITNIDSTLKYEKNERILKNIQTLYDVNQQIANVNDFKKLCIETLSKAVEVLMTQKGNLMIYNKITRKLEIRVVWGNIPVGVRDEINNGLVETKSFDLGEGVAGICAETKKPIRVNDRMLIPQVGQHEVFCMASVPILYGNELEGVINMTNKVMIDEEGNKVLDPLGRFTEEDVSLLLGLADQAAVNLNKTRIYSQSITDRMTGLHNGRHFEQVFFDQTCDSIQNNKPMTLAIVDIDRFKQFNDQHGHSAGDEVLKHVAKIFESCIRPGTGDMAFRYGGEEFCMLLPETSPVDAMNVLEGFRAKVEATKLQHGEKNLEVTVSVGLASSVLDGTDTKALFERADETLYACKNGGRNQVRHFASGRMVRFQPTNLIVEIDNAYGETNPSIPTISDLNT